VYLDVKLFGIIWGRIGRFGRLSWSRSVSRWGTMEFGVPRHFWIFLYPSQPPASSKIFSPNQFSPIDMSSVKYHKRFVHLNLFNHSQPIRYYNSHFSFSSHCRRKHNKWNKIRLWRQWKEWLLNWSYFLQHVCSF